jgi:3-oxoadipate enol-lactonase/4-carboxymuconolactone decarboxylase
MPILQTGALRQYYRLDGVDDRPVVVFSHSLGCDHTQWDPQAGALAPYFRILRYDTRGHGGTDVTPGDYSIELLARDLIALTEALSIDRFAFCGLSLGGMIGQWIAMHAPTRLTHLILANTSARFPDPAPMETRRRTVLEQGMPAVADAVLGRFFTPASLAANASAVARTRRVLLATNPAGYAGCAAAVRDMDHTAGLSSIATPTVIIVGDHDVSTPWSGHGDALARSIPHAKVERLPTAHLSNLEAPRSFNAALFRFLLPTPAASFEHGLARRRAVLGDAYVDRALASTTHFNRSFQELITEYVWGAVWQRPGLDDRTRRLLVLTAAASLGRWEEFRLHVRAGLAHGLEPCDIEEALLQAAVYAGVPAANTGFQIAAEELSQV